MVWKIWYGNRTTFSNEDGAPSEAPAWGVQTITQVDPITGRYNQTGDNYYVWNQGRWTGVDIVGFIGYLANVCPSIVKFGITVGNDQYREILKASEADPDFPSRSGWKRDEKWRVK